MREYPSHNAFVQGRQILDVALWKMRWFILEGKRESWEFYASWTLRRHMILWIRNFWLNHDEGGFGNKWVSGLSFLSLQLDSQSSVMVIGRPCGFFARSKGPRQEDPLSPMLFICKMMDRAIAGGFLRGFSASTGNKVLSGSTIFYLRTCKCVSADIYLGLHWSLAAFSLCVLTHIMHFCCIWRP